MTTNDGGRNTNTTKKEEEEEEEAEEEESGGRGGGTSAKMRMMRNGGEMKALLPQRVSELFQMYDFGADATPFFRSAFLRDRLPQMLFRNGTSGLNMEEEEGGGGTGVVRHIPIRVLLDDEKPPLPPLPSASSSSICSSSFNGHTPPTNSDQLEMSSTTSSGSSRDFTPRPDPPSNRLGQFRRSPEIRRHFDALFWTPQQARRIAEREQQGGGGGGAEVRKTSLGDLMGRRSPALLGRGPLGGSTVTVHSIPISSPNSQRDREQREMSTPGGMRMFERKRERADEGAPRTESPEPYSVIPFKRGESLNPAVSTPSLTMHNGTNQLRSPGNEKLPPMPPPSRSTAFPSTRGAPPTSPLLLHHGPAASSLPPPILRRTQTTLSLPQQQMLRRGSEPSIVVLDHQENNSNSNNDKKYQNGQEMSPEKDGRKQNSTSGPTQPTKCSSSVELDQSSLSGSASVCSSSSSVRPKSPSLASLRQSLFRFRPTKKFGSGGSSSSLVPSCVRSRQSSGSEAEGEEEVEKEKVEKEKAEENRKQSRESINGSAGGSPLRASTLRLTKFVPDQKQRETNDIEFTRESNDVRKGEREREELDAVEEAIRSLEQFDPSEFISQQYKGNPATISRMEHQPHKGGAAFTQPKVYLARAEPVHLHPSSSANSIPASPLPERRLSLSSLSFALDHPTTATTTPLNNLLSSHSSLLPNSSSSTLDDPSAPPQPGPNAFLANRRRPSTVSSGSATPTGSFSFSSSHQQLFPSASCLDPAFFSQSMDSINRTPRANSPSMAIDRADQNGENRDRIGQVLISRLKDSREKDPGGQQQQRRGVTFDDNPVQHFYAPFDGPPPDYSESDEEEEEDGHGSMDSEEEGDANAAAIEAEAQLRKRFLCSQLTDCAKVVEINALKMSQFVAAGIGHGGWRQQHILRHNLAAIRDTVYTIEFALDELVESLGRISLDVRDLRQTQLSQLALPVQTSLVMLRRLRQSLDATGWSLSALSRPAGTAYAGQDALDQFVAILSHLPRDCYKLVQWIYSLSVWRDSASGPSAPGSSVFLPSGAISSSSSNLFRSSLHPPPPPPAPFPLNALHLDPPRPTSPSASLLNYYSSDTTEDDHHNNNTRRSSEGGTEKGRRTTGNQGWRSRNNEVMDGGESTSSTSSVMTVEEKGGREPEDRRENNRSEEQKGQERGQGSPGTQKEQEGGGREGGGGGTEDMVVQEDDLQSVLSESGSDVHTLLADSLPSSPTQIHQRRVNAELSRSLGSEQRDLFRLYEPQICSHISVLSRNIEEIFSLIESQSDSKLSFQKVQMIFIEGHSLVGIMRVLIRDDAIAQHRALNAFLEHESARMDSLLNECLATAKIAKAKGQSVAAVQAMCSAVVSVSESAHQLKAFWRACAAGGQ